MQQPSPPATPAPPAVPATPAAPAATIAQPPGARVLTAREVSALRARRSELSNQLQSADSRREELVGNLKEIGFEQTAARAGLEQRIKVLDERILQLEADLAETGRQLTTSMPGALTSSTQPARTIGGFDSDNVAAVSGVFTIFVLAPLALAAARLMWKRAVSPVALPRALNDTADRLGRLEHAVDAIAIEVERVSEGQRFVTRVLSESPARPGLGVGQSPAEPIPVRQAEAVPASQRGA